MSEKLNVKMKIREVEELDGILGKLCKTTEIEPRWEFAGRVGYISDTIERLKIAKEPIPETVAYSKKQGEILRELGTRVPMAGGGYSYQVEEQDVLKERLDDLNDEYKDVLDKEESRKFELDDFLNKEVEFEFEIIEHRWCGTLIDGTDMVFLMKHGLIGKPTDAELGRNKAAKNSKKRKAKSRK